MAVQFFVRLKPLAGKDLEFQLELLRVVEASRSEAGCLAVHAFESLREPREFTIHSEWVAEFELHVAAAKELLTHPIEGLRTRQIGGGAGAG